MRAPRISRRCSENLPVVQHHSHPAVQVAGLAVLVRRSRQVEQYFMSKKLEVHSPLPGRSRETRPARLVHHRDNPTSTAN